MNHQALIAETKISCQEYLPKLINACSIIAEKIQSGIEWFGLYEQFLEGISWFISAVVGIQKISRDDLAGIHIDEFNSLLKQLEEALSNKDYITLSDVLEYEVKEKLVEYFTIIEKESSK